ncbi:FCD domain-containing protein [Georgenia satyanarayanai]|uniref:FCD domain-containing protein n=1 Tax=Georgenia satyanarayanai TaxID=860221 RepID=UPI00203BF3A7|nr:FCD domain-containing protein [Georgenia satyanarayanai]MCM3659789.1 FCD domain-containing protein [Georgenia satyanarayanai]
MANDREEVLRALLAVLASAPGPIGTRAARLALEEMGIAVSESSVSRRLRELDERGWSVPVGAKGRVLSPDGQRRHAALEFSDRTTASIGQAVDVRDVHDLLDLLHARKAVESAAAADAATHASTADLDDLQRLVAQHRQAVGTPDMAHQPGLDLHRRVAAIAPNRMLKTLTGLVLAPHLDRVESVLDIVLGSDSHQSDVVEEHQQIADAICSRDPEAAERAMDAHFDKMIDAGQRLIVGESASVVSRLLSWMETSAHSGHMHVPEASRI